MLINFGFKNMTSFKEKAQLSLVAYNKLKTNRDALVTVNNTNVLKVACIYGANASGKSNLIQSLMALTSLFGSVGEKDIPILTKLYIPFKLSTETESAPTSFFIDFYLQKLETTFHYEFSISAKEIVSESLSILGQKDIVLFQREKEKILYSNPEKFPEGKNINSLKLLRKDVSVLSISFLLNGPISKEIVKFFRQITRGNSNFRRGLTTKISETELQDIALALQNADVGVSGLGIHTLSELAATQQEIFELQFKHIKYNKERSPMGEITFSRFEESDGTMRYMDLVRSLFDLKKTGGVLLVDELEQSLHPLLVENLIQKCNNKTNKNIQLIFTTHNTNLLHPNLFRKDQIYFVDKNKYGESCLYSLVDYAKEARQDVNWEDRYLGGMYGAIPVLKTFRI